MTPTSYKTNKHAKNWSVEEQLERALDALENRIELFEPDEDSTLDLFRLTARDSEHRAKLANIARNNIAGKHTA